MSILYINDVSIKASPSWIYLKTAHVKKCILNPAIYVIYHEEIKTGTVYVVDNLYSGFNKTGFSDYLPLLVSHIIVLFSNVLKAILHIILYRYQLK